VKALEGEMAVMRQLKYKLNNQLRHFKEMRLFTSLVKITQKALPIIASISAADIKAIDSLPVGSVLEMVKSAMQIGENLGERLKDFVKRIYLIQFSTLALASVAVLHYNLGKIKKKLDIILRIQTERT
jgi:hypothetical protein